MGESLPGLHAHLKYYGVDISTVTFNWFITIFIDAVPFEVRNKISVMGVLNICWKKCGLCAENEKSALKIDNSLSNRVTQGMISLSLECFKTYVLGLKEDNWSSKSTRRTLKILERLSMTFTADGKRQRLPLIFYSFLVILK